jgi:hypothetical protein
MEDQGEGEAQGVTDPKKTAFVPVDLLVDEDEDEDDDGEAVRQAIPGDRVPVDRNFVPCQNMEILHFTLSCAFHSTMAGFELTSHKLQKGRRR